MGSRGHILTYPQTYFFKRGTYSIWRGTYFINLWHKKGLVRASISIQARKEVRNTSFFFDYCYHPFSVFKVHSSHHLSPYFWLHRCHIQRSHAFYGLPGYGISRLPSEAPS